MKTTKNVVLAAMFAALSMIIVLIIPSITPSPFTVTLGSHVPTMIGMFINPFVAVGTVIGSVIIFATKYPLVVPVRSATHAVFALAGSYIIKKRGTGKLALALTWFVTLILHVSLEIIVISLMVADIRFVLPVSKADLPGFSAFLAGAVAFAVHHTIDFILAATIARGLKKTKLID